MNQFDPVLYSREECAFLLEHLGKPTSVALRDIKPPVNVKAMREVFDRVNELEDLKKHSNLHWAGVDAIKASIKKWIEVDSKWEADYIRTRGLAPRQPSMYSFDVKGRPHRSGIGSDTHRPRTWFDAQGQRHPFAIDLQPEYTAEWAGPGFTETPLTAALEVNQVANRIECFCGHTESFNPDKRSSWAAARARMSRHMRKATERVEEHKEGYELEFGS
jgi:hypothetical protein